MTAGWYITEKTYNNEDGIVHHFRIQTHVGCHGSVYRDRTLVRLYNSRVGSYTGELHNGARSFNEEDLRRRLQQSLQVFKVPQASVQALTRSNRN